MQAAALVAAFGGAGFESAEQGPTHAAKSRIRGDVTEGDFSPVTNRTYCEDRTALDGHEHRIIRTGDPRGDDFRRFVSKPSPKDFWIIAMIGDA
jgi:hypothetical protein